MDGQKAALVIGITLLVVILLNLRILVSFRKGSKNSPNLYQAFSRVVKRGRNPWTSDKEKLVELSKRVEELTPVGQEENPEKNN